MATNNTKITTELTWNYLKSTYYVGKANIKGNLVDVDELQEIIDDGTLLQQIKDCAERMYDGDIGPVVRAMKHNLASARTNTKAQPDTPTKAKNLAKIEKLWGYCGKLIADSGSTRASNKSGKSYWTWSKEEIEAVDITDVRTLKSIRDNMASVKAKYPEKIEDMDEFQDRYALACRRYSEANKAAKQAPAVDTDAAARLLKAVEKGRISAADRAALAEILKTLSK